MADKKQDDKAKAAATEKPLVEAVAAEKPPVDETQASTFKEKTAAEALQQLADVRKKVTTAPLSPREAFPDIAEKELVRVTVPRDFTLTLDDRRRVAFTRGSMLIPPQLVDHFYVKAHKVVAAE
jgi:hypothetical protein